MPEPKIPYARVGGYDHKKWSVTKRRGGEKNLRVENAMGNGGQEVNGERHNQGCVENGMFSNGSGASGKPVESFSHPRRLLNRPYSYDNIKVNLDSY